MLHNSLAAPIHLSRAITAARRDLRVRCWIWLAFGLSLFVVWENVLAELERAFGTTLGTSIHLAVLIGAALLVMVIVQHQSDRRLGRIQQLVEAYDAAYQHELALSAKQRDSEQVVQLELAQQEAVQATARTVAHTLNQPLTIIRGYAQLMAELSQVAQDKSDLYRIIEQVDRAAADIQQLLRVMHYQTTTYPDGTMMLDITDPASSGTTST